MSLSKLYDPENFRTLGHEWVDKLADHLGQAQRRELPVVEWRDPEVAKNEKPEIDQYIRWAMHLQHPRFVGHQNGIPAPEAALSGLVTGLLNGSSAIYEMGPLGTMIEGELIRWLCSKLGYGPHSDGIMTSGGTLGNLTALLTARQVKAGGDIWNEGMESQLGVLVAENSHYSVKRALQIMGMGAQGAVLVKLKDGRLDPKDLKASFERSNRKIFAVVAAAGSTGIGAYDFLPEIADFCEEKDLWFHVDGAHGAPACLSPKHRHKTAGIHRADSVVWDMHKMMMVPGLSTAVLYKNRGDSYRTFAQQASYLFDRPAEEEWFNICHRTLECTKNDMSFRVYWLLKRYGEGIFVEYVERQFDLAEKFADLLEQAPDFELATRPECNILCFRYVGKGEIDQDQIRKRIIASGKFYLVKTKLEGKVYLRTTLQNPLTTVEDLRDLMDTIRAS